MVDSLRTGKNQPELRDRLVIVATSRGEHSLRSQAGIGSASYCLLRQLKVPVRFQIHMQV